MFFVRIGHPLFLYPLFNKYNQTNMKYLITGLGNIGAEYLGTRHNIGFRVVNHLVESAGATFSEERYGAIARMRVKNCELVVLKPNTFMNLSVMRCVIGCKKRIFLSKTCWWSWTIWLCRLELCV